MVQHRSKALWIFVGLFLLPLPCLRGQDKLPPVKALKLRQRRPPQPGKEPLADLSAKLIPGQYAISSAVKLRVDSHAGPQKFFIFVEGITQQEVTITKGEKPGTRRVEVAFAEIVMKVQNPMVTLTLDTKTGNTDPPLAPIAALKGQKAAILLDRKGKIVDRSEVDALLDKTENPQVQNIVKTTFLQDLPVIFGSVVLPEKSVGPGGIWHCEITNQLMPSVKLPMEVQVEKIRKKAGGTFAELKIYAPLTFPAGMRIPDQPGLIKKGALLTEGEAVFNMDEGFLQEIQQTAEARVDVSIQGQVARTQTKVETHMIVKKK